MQALLKIMLGKFLYKIRMSKGCSQISYWQIAQRQDSFRDFEETLESLSMPFRPQ